ncbi:MAG: DUF721 domain-containing protein [Spirochaetales bacterium]|jgi:hypothetical protein|nr:DUF721 domain-containing protein [Spirochaetales bacterium]
MKKAGEILTGILGSREAKRAGSWSSFFRGWSDIAGEDLAAHTEVKDVVRGAVLIEADHPGWLQMLQIKKPQILKGIQKSFPELDIVDIRCFIRKTPESEIRGNEKIGPDYHQVEKAVDENSEEYQEFQALLRRLREQAEG